MSEEKSKGKKSFNELPKQRPLTAEQKTLCEQWKISGINRGKFCKEHGIPTSTFYGWCNKLWQTKKLKKPSFVPVIPLIKLPNQMSVEQSILEISLPSQIRVKVSLPSRDVVTFIQELSHAATIIR